MWNSKYKSCKSCNTKKVRHCAFGLCLQCYKSQYNKKHKAKCSLCKKINPISTKENKKITCKYCRKKYFFKIIPKKCSLCHRIKRIDKIEENKLICSGCYKKHCRKPIIDICSICNKKEVRMLFKNNKSICGYCYRQYFYKKKKKECDRCKKLGYIAKICSNKEKICSTCYKRDRKIYYSALEHSRKSKCKITEFELNKIKLRDKSCVYCNSKENLCFDHIIPLSKGGKTKFDNFVLACKKCNTSKGNKDVFEWCKRKRIKIPKIISK